MIKRILQLPAIIANQIAAGEVIERPASVVKELLENSFDAGATVIHIDISYGGLNQIKISDNGSGIVAEDLPLAISAHATSKITSLDDLYAINSMGFRGEALASIASIAKVTISSKPEYQEHAMMLAVQGTKQNLAPCARTTGTTIDVSDLFFNAPVRKRFLKSERLEFQAIEGVVKRFALSAPHISLTLNHNSKLIFSLPPALSEQTKQLRMTKILGSAFIKNAVFLSVEHSSMHLTGLISGIDYQRSQNDRQWVYINQRMVKDKLINHALKQAYDGLLYPGRFPSCLLYFTMNTNEVDVNVHPTKHEVRFQQPRLVHDFFMAQLTNALASSQNKEPTGNNNVCEPAPQFSKTEIKLNGTLNERQFTPVLASKRSINDELPWTNLNKRYSLLWIEQQPYLVDVTCLHQAWLKEQLKEEHLPLASRPLLVAVRYRISEQCKKQGAKELQQVLHSLGIIVEIQDEELLIRSIPVRIPYLDLRNFFERIMQLELYSVEQLQEQLVQAQLIEAAQFSIEERAELSQYLIKIQKNMTRTFVAYKPFTADDCRMLLDV